MYFLQIFSLNLYEVFPVFRRLFGSEERKRVPLNPAANPYRHRTSR